MMMPQQPQGGKAGGGKPGGTPRPQPMPENRGPLTGVGAGLKPAIVGDQKPNQRIPGPGGKAGGGKPGGAPNPMMGGPALPRAGGKLGGNERTLADIARPQPMVNFAQQQPQVQNQQQITTPSGS